MAVADAALRNITMLGLRDAVGKNDPHTIRILLDDWRQKNVITDADVAEINGLLNGGSSSEVKQGILDNIGAYDNFEIARQTMDAVSKGLLTNVDTSEIYSAMYQADQN
ncbi:MAG: hypothetical protein IJT94_05530 [Oscillibacter sp.]|nr:hypothetical protein [Oscillibacter sp.]